MTSPLIVVPPLAITDAMLIATNVAEADYSAWSAATTYALGNRVIRTSVHKVYESLQASNLNHTPESEPTWWVEVSPTNRWKCFDASNSTQTAQATSITYQLRPGMAVSALAALNVTNATSVRVRVVDPTYGTVYDKTTSLLRLPAESGWWSWFFGERKTPTFVLATDLPSLPAADIYVDFAGGTTLAVGVLLIGQARTIGLGATQGTRLGIQDYSRKETNAFGDVVVAQRAFAKRANFMVPILRGEIDSTLETLAALRTTPCLWGISKTLSSGLIFGFYKDTEVLINYYAYAECVLQIEGLT